LSSVSSTTGCAGSCRLHLFLGPNGYHNAERGAFTQNGLNVDRATVHLDDTLGNRKSQPAAALLTRAAVVGLLELFKYFSGMPTSRSLRKS
jgi:hypothetical protein